MGGVRVWGVGAGRSWARRLACTVMASTLDPARRAALVGMQLSTLVADQGVVAVDTPVGLGGGAAVMSADGVAWVLLAEQPERGLGGALAWAVRREARSVHVLAPAGGGVLARRAVAFSMPITVAHLAGRSVQPAVPEPLIEASAVPADHRIFIELIEAGGATPVEEHGVLGGEVAGLEVCRVIDDPVTGQVRLEVGIGAHDRETFQLLHGDKPKVEALADVVRTVAAQRRPGAVPHPLNQLAASRLLRSTVLDAPSVVGAQRLRIVEPPIARTNLKDQVPCAAFDDERGVVVVCTSGVDLDVVPWATDAIASTGATSCCIVAPARDVIDIQCRLAALVRASTEFVPLPLQ